MKILHVWDQAGVGAVLAKYQRLLGHEAQVIKRYGFDPCGIDEFYNTRCFDVSAWRFYQIARSLAKDFDILHIHSAYKLCLVMPFAKKVIEFHGCDLRGHDSLLNKIGRKMADKIIVSTPDLLEIVEDAVWLPNPVDTDHFVRKGHFKPHTALYVHNWYESAEKAHVLADEYNLDLTVLDRSKGVMIKYKAFPAYLSQFEYFISRHAIRSLSKTALEALACGLKVIRWDGEVLQGLPDEHRPDKVANRTIQIYEEIL